jgi:PAS domain S-box-containing protein
MRPEAQPHDEPATKLDELLDFAPCGFLSFGEDGHIELINETLLEALGYERHLLVGQHVERIFTVGTRIFYQTHWFPLLRLHGRAEEIFLILRTAGGQEVGVLANAARRQADERAVYDCIMMRVRERQKYEDELLRARRQLEAQTAELEASGEELRAINDELLEQTHELERSRAAADEANRAKSAFLAVMSHELRTPLNAISGYAELLEMGIHGPVTEAQRDALGRIMRSQRHLLRLINDVLNLARIEAGRVDYLIADVPVAQIVDEVTPMVEPQLAAKGLSFTSRVEPDLTAHVDREKVQQVLLNLLSNAIKFTPEGGQVSVRSETRPQADGMLYLAVSDTGIGIPPEKLESVFEPFVQVDVALSAKREGTGLGLAISRDLARGMGGDLRARSVPGQGSTFTLSLPRSPRRA